MFIENALKVKIIPEEGKGESRIFGNDKFIHYMHNPNIAKRLDNRQSENV